MLGNDIQACGFSPEQSGACCSLGSWSQKSALPQMAGKSKALVFQSEEPKRAVAVLSNTIFMMGIQDTLKINSAWDTLISRGSWNSVGTSLFAGNLRLILSVTGAAGARFYYNCVTFNTPWRDFNFSIFPAYNKSNVLL